MTPALDLLDEATRNLREGLAPDLSGEARYQALLTANAIATARRELALAGPIARAQAAVAGRAAQIRAGQCDGDAALYDLLCQLARLRAYVTDPAALSDQDRQQIEAMADL